MQKTRDDAGLGSGLSSYATLINSKIIIPSASTNYVAIDRYYLVQIMRFTIEQIYIDEDWYLDAYPDVRDAIRSAKVGSAAEHYIRFGYFESRMPYKIAVAEPWYLNSYPDIQDAISRNVYLSGQAHFNEAGFAEGRLPFPDFNLQRRNHDKKIGVS